MSQLIAPCIFVMRVMKRGKAQFYKKHVATPTVVPLLEKKWLSANLI